jgi:hypothetical protein
MGVVGTVSAVGLAVDRFGPAGLRNVWRIPFQTAKAHLENHRSQKPGTDHSDERQLPSVWPRSDSDRKRRHADQDEVIRERQHIREIFKRARASGSQDEMRQACFGVIPFLAGNSTEIEDLGPLAPLPRKSRFAGKTALFDRPKDTRILRALETDGTTSMLFIVVNADFEFEPPEDSKNALLQICEGFVNQFDIWERERTIRFKKHQLVPVVFALREHVIITNYVPMFKRFDPNGGFSWNDEVEGEQTARDN